MIFFVPIGCLIAPKSYLWVIEYNSVKQSVVLTCLLTYVLLLTSLPGLVTIDLCKSMRRIFISNIITILNLNQVQVLSI